MHTPTVPLPLLPALLSLLLIACGGEQPPAGAADAAPALRVYDVSPALSDNLALALNDVLAGSERVAGVGKASRRIDGRLLVSAPASMHDDIERAIADLQEGADATSVPAGPLRLAFWVIESAPGAAPDPRLEPIAPVLEQLRSPAQEQFVLVEHMATTAAADGGGGVVDAVLAEADFRLRAVPDGIVANVNVVNRVRAAEGGFDEYLSQSREVPLALDGFVVLHQFLVGGGEQGAPSRMRSVVLQASRPAQD